ncbi:Uncharacterized protein AC506_0766 [Pseudomonas syringae pv. maculicola str. M6]|nr:Uncharacterized protein AC506_0766 [Pseudomonas syringae pv. maculicola str. M6]
MCTTVGRNGRNAHLRQNLEQALGDAFTVVLEDFVQVAQHFAGTDQVTQHFVGQERIDRRSAKTDQHSEVVRVTRRGGFDQNVAVATQALLGQAVVNRANGQRGVHRQFARCNVAVAQHNQGMPGTHRFFGLIGDVTHSGFKAQAFVVVQVDDVALETRTLQVHQRTPFGRRNDWRAEDYARSMLWRFLEDIALGTEADLQRHDDGFTQRVDRRVGNLRELLAEVIVRRTHATRQHCHRRVVTHRAHGFLALLAERTQHLITLLERDLIHLHVLLELLAVIESRAVVVVFHGGLNAQGILAQPLLVRMTRLEAVVDSVGVEDLAGFSVHGKNLPRTDTALGDDVFGLVVPHADFRREGDVAILGRDPARRAQAVAVEQADRVTTFGHHDAGRAVPRLHVHGVVFIEGA